MSKIIQLALLLVVVRYCDRVTCAHIPSKKDGSNMLSLNSTCPEGVTNAMLSPSNYPITFQSSNLISYVINNSVNCTAIPPKRGARFRSSSCQVHSNFERNMNYCCHSSDAVDSTLTLTFTKAEGNIPDKVRCQCRYFSMSKRICSLLMISTVLQ